MHQSILAKRKATATQRIITQASALVDHLELDPSLAEALQPKGIKDLGVVEMMRLEALAELMDQFAALAGVTEPVTTVTEPKQPTGDDSAEAGNEPAADQPADALGPDAQEAEPSSSAPEADTQEGAPAEKAPADQPQAEESLLDDQVARAEPAEEEAPAPKKSTRKSTKRKSSKK